MLITWTCTYTNMRMSVESGGGATSNIEPDYIHHAHRCSDGKPRRSRPASLRECCTWLSCLRDSVDYVHGGDPYRRPRDCRQTRCFPEERCPNRRPCASHFLTIIEALLDAQRTGNLCIKRCKVHFVILAHALNKYCVIPFSYHAPRVCANKPGALINQTLQYLQLHSVELFYIPHLSSNVEEFTLIQL